MQQALSTIREMKHPSREVSLPATAEASTSWQDIHLPSRVMDEVVNRAIALDISRKLPQLPVADEVLSGDMLTQLERGYGISRESIQEAITQVARRSEILYKRQASLERNLARSGRTTALTDEQTDRLISFEHELENAFTNLAELVDASASDGRCSIRGFELKVPLDVLTFTEHQWNPDFFKFYLCPGIGQLGWLTDWGHPRGTLRIPKPESATHPRLQELFAVMEQLGIEPSLRYGSWVTEGVLTARFPQS